jgi:hypothetical protein
LPSRSLGGIVPAFWEKQQKATRRLCTACPGHAKPRCLFVRIEALQISACGHGHRQLYHAAPAWRTGAWAILGSTVATETAERRRHAEQARMGHPWPKPVLRVRRIHNHFAPPCMRCNSPCPRRERVVRHAASMPDKSHPAAWSLARGVTYGWSLRPKYKLSNTALNVGEHCPRPIWEHGRVRVDL